MIPYFHYLDNWADLRFHLLLAVTLTALLLFKWNKWPWFWSAQWLQWFLSKHDDSSSNPKMYFGLQKRRRPRVTILRLLAKNSVLNPDELFDSLMHLFKAKKLILQKPLFQSKIFWRWLAFFSAKTGCSFSS